MINPFDSYIQPFLQWEYFLYLKNVLTITFQIPLQFLKIFPISILNIFMNLQNRQNINLETNVISNEITKV